MIGDFAYRRRCRWGAVEGANLIYHAVSSPMRDRVSDGVRDLAVLKIVGDNR